MKAIRVYMSQALAGLLCLCLLLWSVAPSFGHQAEIIQTLADHAQMIEDHGHSHGLEEDLFWAMHGHSHDEADHDHSQMVLPSSRDAAAIAFHSDPWGMSFGLAPSAFPPPIERPPRV